MRIGVIFLILLWVNHVGFSQDLDIDARISKINDLLPTLNSNPQNTDIESRSQVYLGELGVLKLETTNTRKGKVYDKSEFNIIVNEIDKNKLNVKKIECCNILELYCEDNSFDCVEYIDRTSKQVKPVPYVLMNKSWKENQHIIFNLERLIESIGESGDHNKEKVRTKETVKLYKNGGVYLVNLKLGNKPVTAILDSGASVVSISKEIEEELLKDKIITRNDYISPAKYRIANGQILTAKRFILPTLTVGKLKMKNVVCSIVEDSSSILLGKSFLDQFAKWSIDNAKQTLTLEK